MQWCVLFKPLNKILSKNNQTKLSVYILNYRYKKKKLMEFSLKVAIFPLIMSP